MKNSNIARFVSLILDSNEFHKTSYYAQKLQVSNKTISNYINEIKYLLRTIPDIHLNVSSKHGVGICIEGTEEDKGTFKKAFFHTIEISPTSSYRQKIILEKILMFDQQVSVRKLSNKFDVSSTSIVKDLECIEQNLLPYDLKLSRDKRGTRMNGKEQRIRSAKRKFIFDEFTQNTAQNNMINMDLCESILTKYIKNDVLAISKNMIEIIQDKLDFRLDINYYIQIFVSFSIFVTRIKEDQILSDAPMRPVVTELHILKTYPIAVELSQWLFDQHGLTLKDFDIRWMNARIAGVYHEDQKAKAGYSKQIEDIVNELLAAIEGVFNVNFQDDEILKTGLANHFVPMISRLKNNIKIANPFILQIKQQYTAMFSVLCLSSSIIEKNTGFQLSDDEIGFILIHVQVALERHNLSKKIAIVYDCGLANAHLIENQMKINLPTFDVLELIHISNLKEKYLKDFDFIISTLNLNIRDKPNVVISPVADTNDIAKIKDAYASLIMSNKETRFHYLLQSLTSDMILVNQKFKTKKEVLDKANEILLSKNFITEDFYSSVLNREKLSSTEIGNGIAIPHGLDTYVNKTAIVLITLEQPILWKEDNVNIIFFTAASLEKKDFLKELLKDLYHLISSDNFVSHMSHAKTKEEVFAILSQKN